jgi:hypothetical protein
MRFLPRRHLGLDGLFLALSEIFPVWNDQHDQPILLTPVSDDSHRLRVWSFLPRGERDALFLAHHATFLTGDAFRDEFRPVAVSILDDVPQQGDLFFQLGNSELELPDAFGIRNHFGGKERGKNKSEHGISKRGISLTLPAITEDRRARVEAQARRA